ncbi:lasso peptide biosynthesis PqqD family chaperone [Streptomyces smyrnaeus]|uniref:Lasso peptide biosynthesis PqqD family chaperone n=1 Tax=Streptomyces smyrnaeus TaxID=1387713 RepID=A0ABS3Y0B1_9ACTN|nr:lasso peptide biosynthesis PqqD family chaperone [Streptomyces smyrnaeus]MBO8200766.1 lasso peptide biosynthesis PqqD family chaperone [Streptomyces smyrnaeus]
MVLRLHPDVSITDAETDTDADTRTHARDGIVLLNERTGGYWQLNATGAFVLRCLLDGHEASDIASQLAERHQADPEQVGRDVAAVVERLRDAQLVQDH